MELWQNGNMRWLGQNLQATTQAKPIPPITVKSLHVNQTTTNGTSSEVPFQVEDWASDYRIPLGLTNNASLFSSRTMLVFLINKNVSKVTIWWNGSDTAVQTPLAYTNKYFTVNTDPTQRTINNTKLWLKVVSDPEDHGPFKVTSKMGTSNATAILMQINNVVAGFGYSEPMWAIVNGPVRVVLHHEVEWGSNALLPNCPNVYAHIVLTLPANATYYTYQLRLMFTESARNRTITDLCPIRLTSSISQLQTENGTAAGYPIVSNGTGLFYNQSMANSAHHWSQFISGTGTSGSGIMFTDSCNNKLYYFDSLTTNKTGTLKVSDSTKDIMFAPVTLTTLYNFTSALDITWNGAVVTFDATTPIYTLNSGNATGLWIIVEYPPTVAVTTES
jgi:hypothetical protein